MKTLVIALFFFPFIANATVFYPITIKGKLSRFDNNTVYLKQDKGTVSIPRRYAVDPLVIGAMMYIQLPTKGDHLYVKAEAK